MLFSSAIPAIASTTLSLQTFIVPAHDPAHGYLPYVNPAAPKGGVIRLKAADVTYTTFNPYGVVDVPAAGIGRTFASLMVAALDDPLTVYPYLATHFDWTGTTVTVDLQEKAQFHDGTPLTGDDVQATFQALKQSDLPLHQQLLHTLERVEVPSPHTVRFIFKENPLHETVFFLMQLPILSRFDLKEGRLPTGDTPLRSSGPYYVADYRWHHYVSYKKTPHWWGADLFMNKGQYNFDEMTYLYYKNQTVALEAFKKHEYDWRHEKRALYWMKEYDCPAVQQEKIVLAVFPLNELLGLNGLFLNLNNPIFQDKRVRQALNLVFDFEWLNQTMLFNFYQRNQSIFPNMPFTPETPITAQEKHVNNKFSLAFTAADFERFQQVPTAFDKRPKRERLAAASNLLAAAGWVFTNGKRVHQKTGKLLTFSLLTNRPGTGKLLQPFVQDLQTLGINATIDIVDDPTFECRRYHDQYDIIHYTHQPFLLPTTTILQQQWGSACASLKGTYNLSHVKNPVLDRLVQSFDAAHTLAEVQALAQLLNRLVYDENYVIPMWGYDRFYVAYWNNFSYPETAGRVSLNTWWVKQRT